MAIESLFELLYSGPDMLDIFGVHLTIVPEMKVLRNLKSLEVVFRLQNVNENKMFDTPTNTPTHTPTLAILSCLFQLREFLSS